MFQKCWYILGFYQPLCFETAGVKRATSIHLLVWTCFSYHWSCLGFSHLGNCILLNEWYRISASHCSYPELTGVWASESRLTEHIFSLKETEELYVLSVRTHEKKTGYSKWEIVCSNLWQTWDDIQILFTGVDLVGFIFNNCIEDNRYCTLCSCKMIQLDSLQRQVGILWGWVLHVAIGFWEREMFCCIEGTCPLLPMPYLLCDPPVFWVTAFFRYCSVPRPLVLFSSIRLSIVDVLK